MLGTFLKQLVCPGKWSPAPKGATQALQAGGAVGGRLRGSGVGRLLTASTARGLLYLEAARVAPAGLSPAPLFTTASREALCRSRASKNEASGPTGANAMMADTAAALRPLAPASLPALWLRMRPAPRPR